MTIGRPPVFKNAKPYAFRLGVDTYPRVQEVTALARELGEARTMGELIHLWTIAAGVQLRRRCRQRGLDPAAIIAAARAKRAARGKRKPSEPFTGPPDTSSRVYED